MDTRCAPARIIRLHSADEFPELVIDLGPTKRSGAQTPESPESGAVPRGHRLGFHDHQGSGPAGPPAPERNPKESVDVTQYRPRPFPFENDELLTSLSSYAIPSRAVVRKVFIPRPR